MKDLFRWLAPILLTALLFDGCRRKDEQIAREAESSLPPAEQMPAEKTAPGGSEAPSSTARSTNPQTDPALAGVPAELLASDRAYDAWFKKYNLDLNDPKMLDADDDGDGASNRDEFMADTNPRDPNSRPGIHKFMRLKQYTEVRLPLMLESVEGDTARIRRLEEGDAKPEAVRPGQTIRGMNVARVISRRDVDKHGEPVDTSRVILDDPATNEKVVLIKDMPAKTAASSAIITSADGQTSLTVRQGDVFTWPTEPATSYKVLDLREDQIVVQQVETKKMWTIPKM